jgi:hypothetical protein
MTSPISDVENVKIIKDAAETIYIKSPDTSFGVFCFNSYGDLFLNSDWGMFGYAWRHFGENFKEFLQQCNAEYIVGKFALNYNEDKSNNKRLDSKTNERRLKAITKLVDLFIQELNKQ